jgi:hypothetical protein
MLIIQCGKGLRHFHEIGSARPNGEKLFAPRSLNAGPLHVSASLREAFFDMAPGLRGSFPSAVIHREIPS